MRRLAFPVDSVEGCCWRRVAGEEGLQVRTGCRRNCIGETVEVAWEAGCEPEPAHWGAQQDCCVGLIAPTVRIGGRDGGNRCPAASRPVELRTWIRTGFQSGCALLQGGRTESGGNYPDTGGMHLRRCDARIAALFAISG